MLGQNALAKNVVPPPGRMPSIHLFQRKISKLFTPPPLPVHIFQDKS